MVQNKSDDCNYNLNFIWYNKTEKSSYFKLYVTWSPKYSQRLAQLVSADRVALLKQCWGGLFLATAAQCWVPLEAAASNGGCDVFFSNLFIFLPIYVFFSNICIFFQFYIIFSNSFLQFFRFRWWVLYLFIFNLLFFLILFSNFIASDGGCSIFLFYIYIFFQIFS